MRIFRTALHCAYLMKLTGIFSFWDIAYLGGFNIPHI